MPVVIENAVPDVEPPPRSWPNAIMHGFLRRCPACREGRLLAGFVKVNDACPRCGEEFHHQRADDAPPYFTIFIVAHIIVPLVLVVEKLWRPDLLIHMLIWIPATLILTLALMPAIKGAIVGLQWALRMHGFSGKSEE
ncbi:DUF983 domain-containing protein [Taklimakanibacter deserti]|uniref:DUF983 domain-containing protein n=1 Tax=Taklimakanibacter deserti TaxID=2267839 RepID=UPI000E65534C